MDFGYPIIDKIADREATIPKTFLAQNFPNPFNPSTKISFTLQVSGFTTLKVFNVLGREVATLVNEKLEPGRYNATWDATGFPSGVYFYRLQTGKFIETKRLVLVK